MLFTLLQKCNKIKRIRNLFATFFIGVKMKKLFLILFICLICISLLFPLSACVGGEQEEYTKGMVFTLNSDGESYTVSSYGTATDTNVVIPSKYDGKPVTIIGGDAFKDTPITSLVIKDGVKEIRSKAFMNCTALESVVIPSTVQNIGTQAFFKTSLLKTVYFNAENCTDLTVHNGTFYGAGKNVLDGLIITIGKDVVRIPNYIFVPGDNENVDNTAPNVSGLVFEDGGVLSEIGERSFSNFVRVMELTIPATVKKIGAYSFINWNNLTTLKFATGSKLETIGRTAFYNCIKITQLIFPAGLKTIEQDVFYCSTLGEITRVVIPSSVEYIGSVAFHNHRNATFYLESETVPTTWNANWNNLSRPVLTGVDINGL